MHVCTVQVNWLEQACMQLQLGKLSTNWVNFPDWVHNGRGLTVKPPDLPLDTLMVRSHSFWSKGQNVKLRLNYKNTTLTLNYTVNGANKYILDIKLLGDCLQSHQTHIDIYWAWNETLPRANHQTQFQTSIYLVSGLCLLYQSTSPPTRALHLSIHPITLVWNDLNTLNDYETKQCGVAKLSPVGQTEGGSISYLQLKIVARWFPYYVQEWPGVIVLPNYNVCVHLTCFNFYIHNKLWKILKEMGNQTTWPASWETYMQVRKQQLELDMEQQTCSK